MKRGIVLIIFFVCTFCAIGFAEKIGYVDVISVILFHPEMNWFEPETGEFVRKFDTNLPIEEQNRIIKQRMTARNKALKKANLKYRKIFDRTQKLLATRAELKENYYAALEELKRKIAFELKGKEGEERRLLYEDGQKRIEKLELNYFKQERQIEDELEKLSDEFEKLKREVNDINYYIDSKPMKVKKIMLEIEKAIAIVAKKRGVSIVLNASVFANKVRKRLKQIDEKWSKILSEKREIDRYHATPVNLLTEMGAKKIKEKDLRMKYYERYLQQEYYLTPFTDQPLLTEFFIKGGVNLTKDVINYLLLKYKVKNRKLLLKLYEILN